MSMADCPGCGRTTERRMRNSPYCHPCVTIFHEESLRCSRLITAAVKVGAMKRAKEFGCVDCGSPARCYDHRDYTRPFDVQPVCDRCNNKRGHAVWHDAYRERSEATYAWLEAVDARKCKPVPEPARAA